MRISVLTRIILFGVLLGLCVMEVRAEETNDIASETPAETSVSRETLRAYLQLQEQLHATQLAIEQIRREAEQARLKNAEISTSHFRLLEEKSAGHLRDLEEKLSIQRASEVRFIVWVVCAFAALSFLAVVLTAYFQWRTVSRLAELSTALPAGRAIGLSPTSLPLNDAALLGSGAVEQSNERLFNVMDRLEKRIRELEQTATPALNGASTTDSATDSEVHFARSAVDLSLPAAASEPEDSNVHETAGAPADIAGDTRIKRLLEQGQALLNEDKPEAAVEAFDLILTLDSGNAEALVKKGSALEKLRKLQEAVDCYDRAIAADNSMTIAYLYKGGLYNRMERFGEAVECYEKALQTQEKRSAA